MTNTTTLLRVSMVWISVVYIICFLGLIAFPGLREWFVLYGLHLQPSALPVVTTVTTFISGLVVWNVIAVFAVYTWSFVWKKVA